MPVCQEKFLLIFLFAFLSLLSLALGQRKRICIICFSLRGALTPCPNAFPRRLTRLTLSVYVCEGVCLLCVWSRHLCEQLAEQQTHSCVPHFLANNFCFAASLIVVAFCGHVNYSPCLHFPSLSLLLCKIFLSALCMPAHKPRRRSALLFSPDKLSQHLIFI